MGLESGQTLLHYRITGKIGAGGMGDVYRAHDSKLGREVALKVLPVEMASDPQRLERFQREARAVAALNHPNIVTIYSVEEADGVHFLTMELVDGKSLDGLIPENGFTLERLLELAGPIAEALSQAHQRGITHRDLKPANVMVSEERRVKVLDFGLAKLNESGSDSNLTQLATEALLTQDGMVLGTLPYMSPEQVEGKPVDHRSDIFSLGILLYEMATGVRPFGGDSRAALMSAILKDAPSSLVESRSDLPRQLNAIISRCLEKSTRERYQTARELRKDLEALGRCLKREGTDTDSPEELQTRRRFSGLAIAAGIVLILALLAGALFTRPGQAKEIETLAVLPFENGSDDQEADYFSDGVTETIISSLSQLPNTRVISRTSVFRYRGQTIDPQSVGSELGVEALVLGRIVQRGENLTVSAELVSTADGRQIWGRQYKKRAADIFEIQGEMAREISSALRVELTSEEESRLTKQYTTNSDAYKAYLRGRYHWAKRSESSLRDAVEHFREAIQIDPTYALAYSGLADCYSLLGYYYVLPRDAYPRAEAAAARALELDDQMAEAHTSLAFVRFYYDWKFEEGQRELLRGLEINPSSATARHWYGLTLKVLGRFEEAAKEMRAAVELDPLSLIINSEFGWFLAQVGRYEEADEQLSRALELDPNFAHGYLRQGWALELQGHFDEAVEAYEKAMELGARYGLGHLGHAYAKAGRPEKAREVLQRLEQLGETQYVLSTEIAYVYAGLGDLDRCFEWLDRAYQDRVSDLLLLRARFAGDLAEDPRFNELLARLGLS